MWVQPLGHEEPLKEGMATHSNTPAWRTPMERGAWPATVHGVTKNRTRLKRLSKHACLLVCYSQSEIIGKLVPPLPLWNSFLRVAERPSPWLSPSVRSLNKTETHISYIKPFPFNQDLLDFSSNPHLKS